jgi:hypothetical protein
MQAAIIVFARYRLVEGKSKLELFCGQNEVYNFLRNPPLAPNHSLRLKRQQSDPASSPCPSPPSSPSSSSSSSAAPEDTEKVFAARQRATSTPPAQASKRQRGLAPPKRFSLLTDLTSFPSLPPPALCITPLSDHDAVVSASKPPPGGTESGVLTAADTTAAETPTGVALMPWPGEFRFPGGRYVESDPTPLQVRTDVYLLCVNVFIFRRACACLKRRFRGSLSAPDMKSRRLCFAK